MKKAFCVLLVIALAIGCVPVVSAASVSDFADVAEGDWFYPAVRFVIERGMFNGTSATSFSPDSTMTRAMFVTVLGRYGKVTATVPSDNHGIITTTDVNFRSEPNTSCTVIATLPIDTEVEIISIVDGESPTAHKWYYVNYNGTKGYIRYDLMAPLEAGFSDVPADEYYSGYVYWAVNTGIAEKTGESTFSPNVAITREEICSMLFNYAQKRNLALGADVAAISFTDKDAIKASYAVAVSAMQTAGVVGGYPDGSFKPTASATRAEVSAMLSRFIDCISYKRVNESSVDANGNYIWGTEVPGDIAVSADYFSDACFIGHSIVVGMKNYFGFANADFYAFNGATAKSVQINDNFTLPVAGTDGSGNAVTTGTLEKSLSLKSYGKVYIMLGTNEAGAGAAHEQAFYTQMAAIVDLVRKSQPDAKIYLFSLTPVSQACSENRADLCRDNIIRYNHVIKRLCADKKAYYLNVFDLLINADGFLVDSLGMSDGIHMQPLAYDWMKGYVRTHVI